MGQQDTYRALLKNLNNVTEEEKKNFKPREGLIQGKSLFLFNDRLSFEPNIINNNKI